MLLASGSCRILLTSHETTYGSPGVGSPAVCQRSWQAKRCLGGVDGVAPADRPSTALPYVTFLNDQSSRSTSSICRRYFLFSLSYLRCMEVSSKRTSARGNGSIAARHCCAIVARKKVANRKVIGLEADDDCATGLLHGSHNRCSKWFRMRHSHHGLAH